MIGGRDRFCPRCGAEICTYNAEPFCWPCTDAAGEGFAWHWSDVISEWVRIPVLELEPPWEPKPGDIVLSERFTPAPRKRDNWDRWRNAGDPKGGFSYA